MVMDDRKTNRLIDTICQLILIINDQSIVINIHAANVRLWWLDKNGSLSTRPTYQLGPFQLGPVPEPTRPIRNSDFWPTRFPSCVSYFRDRLYLKNNLFTVWVITTHNIDGIPMPTALCFELTMQFTVIAREQWMMTHQHEWLIRWLRKFNSVLRLTKNSQIWPRFRDRPPAHPW